MSYTRPTLVALVALGCASATTPAVTPPSAHEGLTPDAFSGDPGSSTGDSDAAEALVPDPGADPPDESPDPPADPGEAPGDAPEPPPDDGPEPPPTPPYLSFDPASPSAGGDVLVSAWDTSPWTHVGLSGSGPCGAIAPIWQGVEEAEPGLWRWSWTAPALTGGGHSFEFTRDQGAVVVTTGDLEVTGPTDCGGDPDPPPLVTGNAFGIGLVGPGDGNQLNLAKELSGDGGWILLIFPGVTKGTTGPDAGWIGSVQGAFDRGLFPVIRLGPPWGQTQIRDDSDDAAHLHYKQLAQAYAAVVDGLPIHPEIPLYVQVHNEPNLCYEWTCDGGGSLDGATRAAEYAGFFRDVADAIHALGKPQIRVSLGALAPGGVLSCECCGGDQCGFQPGATGLDFLDQMAAAVPGIWSRLDFLASHAYPASGTGFGFFVPYDQGLTGLKYFEQELAAIGLPDLDVVITETGWPRSFDGFPAVSAADQAAWTKQAWEGVWLPSPNVIGVTPFMLQDAFWGDDQGFGWVHTGGAKQPVFDTTRALRCSLGFGPC